MSNIYIIFILPPHIIELFPYNSLSSTNIKWYFRFSFHFLDHIKLTLNFMYTFPHIFLMSYLIAMFTQPPERVKVNFASRIL